MMWQGSDDAREGRHATLGPQDGRMRDRACRVCARGLPTGDRARWRGRLLAAGAVAGSGCEARSAGARIGGVPEGQAYQARSAAVPVESKVAGIIAQCEVDVDRFEGSMIFGGATGSDEQRRAAEQWEMRQATAAVGAYQTCESR
jgi:hypothetical protein